MLVAKFTIKTTVKVVVRRETHIRTVATGVNLIIDMLDNHNPIHSIHPNISHPQNILRFWYSLTENRCYPYTRNKRQESSPWQPQSCCS